MKRQCEDLKHLVEAIETSRLTLKQIADAADVTVATLYNWINKKVQNAHHRTMRQVAHALGLRWKLVRPNN